MNALAPIQSSNVEAFRASTDAANICKEIVLATATNIQGRKYVCVEGWQAIAIAHGCTAGARDVERVDGGVKATGEIRRMSDGAIISVAEGFVGEDEPTWFGGQSRGKTLPKRADYAIRAMAQTRAISRACRSAFAHVVVMMNAGLQTTPAEEVPFEGFDNGHSNGNGTARTVENAPPAPSPARERPKPLEGPIKTRAALRDACSQFKDELDACADSDQLNAFLEASGPLILQVRTEAERWWKGDGMEFIGMEKEIERRIELVKMAEANAPTILDAG